MERKDEEEEEEEETKKIASKKTKTLSELRNLKRKPEGNMRTRVTTHKVFRGCGR